MWSIYFLGRKALNVWVMELTKRLRQSQGLNRWKDKDNLTKERNIGWNKQSSKCHMKCLKCKFNQVITKSMGYNVPTYFFFKNWINLFFSEGEKPCITWTSFIIFRIFTNEINCYNCFKFFILCLMLEKDFFLVFQDRASL